MGTTYSVLVGVRVFIAQLRTWGLENAFTLARYSNRVTNGGGVAGTRNGA